LELDLRPALSWIARPSLVKELDGGRFVGYGTTYMYV
jgi:alanine racemase